MAFLFGCCEENKDGDQTTYRNGKWICKKCQSTKEDNNN
jgi:hypothetical protein